MCLAPFEYLPDHVVLQIRMPDEQAEAVLLESSLRRCGLSSGSRQDPVKGFIRHAINLPELIDGVKAPRASLYFIILIAIVLRIPGRAIRERVSADIQVGNSGILLLALIYWPDSSGVPKSRRDRSAPDLPHGYYVNAQESSFFRKNPGTAVAEQ
jgi:hypothetical protein